MRSTKDITKIFKALSDETRLAIVSHIAKEKEIACQELLRQFPLSQPTMSHHFNKLVKAGVLNNRKDGVLWYYTLNKDYLHALGICIEKLASPTTKKRGGVQ